MSTSPLSSKGASCSISLSTTAAGIMIHTARGFSSLFTKSSSESAGVAPSDASCWIGPGDWLKTTHSWPAAIKRRTMLAPMRPSPIMPSCTGSPCRSWSTPALGAVALDERVGGRVVVQVRSGVRSELRDDGEGELLAQLDAPLVERVDVPHRAL